jgi:hypothetical protein
MDEINFEFVKIPKKLIINLEGSYEKNKNKIVREIIESNIIESNIIESNIIESNIIDIIDIKDNNGISNVGD